MPANKRISGTAESGKRTPDKLICNIDLSASAGLPSVGLITVPELFESIGRNASTAKIEVPLGGLNPDVMSNLLHGQRAQIDNVVGASGLVVRKLNGVISCDSHTVNGEHNSLVVQVSDDRVFLKNFKTVGRVAIKESGTETVFQLAQPSLFNRGGLKDGLRNTSGDLAFAPYAEYGVNYAANRTPAINFSQAGIVEYFRKWFVNTLYVNDVIRTHYPFFHVWPDHVIFPEGLGAGLDQTAWNAQAFQQSNQSQGSDRNGREFSIDGVGFSDWFTELLFGSGFSWALVPNGDMNELVLVPVRPQTGGITIITDDPTVGPDRIRFSRNSEDTLTDATVLGAASQAETRVSQKAESGVVSLNAGWTDEDLDNGNNYMQSPAGDANHTAEGVRELFDSIVPNLFLSYKIADIDFFEGTPFEGLPHMGIFYILEHLRSLKERSNATDFAPFYYPIVVEVETSTNNWETVTELTGREITADGKIMLPVLRLLPAAQRNWKWTDDTDYETPMIAKNIRMSCVIFGDARMNLTTWQSGFRNKIGGNFARGFNSNIDADSFVQDYRRGEIIDTYLYQFWYRSVKSYPIPESSAGNTGFVGSGGGGAYRPQAFGAAYLRNDAAKGFAHGEMMMWEHGILKKEGEMEYEGRITNFSLGATIQEFKKSDGSNRMLANANIVGVRHISKGDETTSTVYIGSQPVG